MHSFHLAKNLLGGTGRRGEFKIHFLLECWFESNSGYLASKNNKGEVA